MNARETFKRWAKAIHDSQLLVCERSGWLIDTISNTSAVLQVCKRSRTAVRIWVSESMFVSYREAQLDPQGQGCQPANQPDGSLAQHPLSLFSPAPFASLLWASL